VKEYEKKIAEMNASHDEEVNSVRDEADDEMKCGLKELRDKGRRRNWTDLTFFS
jgi:hypothetical protein